MQQPQKVKPFAYPVWVIAWMLLTFGTLTYASTMLPIAAICKYRVAHQLYSSGKYQESVAAFEDLLKERPDSSQLKFELTRALFKTGTTDSCSRALKLTEENYFDKDERSELKELVPAQYQQSFDKAQDSHLQKLKDSESKNQEKND